MRAVLPLVCGLLCSMAHADRDITVPKGKKILDNWVRAEILGMPGQRVTRTWIGAGFLKAFDAEWSAVRTQGHPWAGTLDLSYNYSPPITDISPGVSVGVLDASNNSDAGRALYLAVTYHYGNEGELNQDLPTQLTLGLWSRKSGLVFLGVNFPVSSHLYLLGEHNSERLAGGLEVRPFPGLAFKTVFERDGTQFGVSLSHKF